MLFLCRAEPQGEVAASPCLLSTLLPCTSADSLRPGLPPTGSSAGSPAPSRPDFMTVRPPPFLQSEAAFLRLPVGRCVVSTSVNTATYGWAVFSSCDSNVGNLGTEVRAFTPWSDC